MFTDVGWNMFVLLQIYLPYLTKLIKLYSRQNKNFYFIKLNYG